MEDSVRPDPKQPGYDSQTLLDVALALSGDLTLEGVLQRIVDSAAELVGAQYGFLGVLNGRSDRRLGTFAVHGLDARHRDLIGRLPEGRGVLGMVIDMPEPLRVDVLSGHPASVGFPALHPAMKSFLGVPIRVTGRVFGNLYLTNKIDGTAFTAADEAVVVALASAAGVAIENARLWEEGERQRRWLLASTEITAALLTSTERENALHQIASGARRAADASFCAVALPESGTSDPVVTIRAVDGLDPRHVGDELDVDRRTYDALAASDGVVVADCSRGASFVEDVVRDWPPLSSLQVLPLTLHDRSGLLILGWAEASPPSAPALDLSFPHAFARQASLAIEVIRAQEDRTRLADLEDATRRGRDLHDLVLQRLFALGLGLDHTARIAKTQPVRERLRSALEEIDRTTTDIRKVAFSSDEAG